MMACDVCDVMAVAMPEDVMSSPKLLPEKYQIFDGHLRTHPVHVANSNCWHDLWADQPRIRENMACVLGLLQHNADEELWSACRDEYDECKPAQQGGSLMWINSSVSLHPDQPHRSIRHYCSKIAHHRNLRAALHAAEQERSQSRCVANGHHSKCLAGAATLFTGNLVVVRSAASSKLLSCMLWMAPRPVPPTSGVCDVRALQLELPLGMHR